MRLSWPRLLSGIAALVPIGMMTSFVYMLGSGSSYAVGGRGLSALLSTDFSGIYYGNKGVYGLLPAMWGTTLLIVTSMALAFPVSLALAVIASELAPGFIGKAVRTALGALSGIPPVVYALVGSIALAQTFMVPKFCGGGITQDTLENLPGLNWSPGLLPVQESTLLGGVILALLVVPFMAPLIEDGLRNVPPDLREASLALGATRWHTLWRVVLRGARPALASAAIVGVLMTMGEALIVAWVVGYESSLPNPLWDTLERTASLASTGAGLAGGFGAERSALTPYALSVSNFTGLLLLIMAFILVTASQVVSRRSKGGRTT